MFFGEMSFFGAEWNVFFLSPGENEMENNNPKKCNAHTQSARKHTYALWAILKILNQMSNCYLICFKSFAKNICFM